MTDLIKVDTQALKEKAEAFEAFAETNKVIEQYKDAVKKVQDREDVITQQIENLQAEYTQTMADLEASKDNPSDFIHYNQLAKDSRNEIEGLEALLEDVKGEKQSIKLQYAQPVAEAVDNDNKALHAHFNKEVSEALENSVYDLLGGLADAKKEIASKRNENTQLVGSILSDMQVRQAFPRFQSKKLRDEIHFNSNSVTLDEFVLRDATKQGQINMPNVQEVAKRKGNK